MWQNVAVTLANFCLTVVTTVRQKVAMVTVVTAVRQKVAMVTVVTTVRQKVAKVTVVTAVRQKVAMVTVVTAVRQKVAMVTVVTTVRQKVAKVTASLLYALVFKTSWPINNNFLTNDYTFDAEGDHHLTHHHLPLFWAWQLPRCT